MSRKKILPYSKIEIDVGIGLAPNEDLFKPNCTFLGEWCAQAYSAMFMWEKLLNKYNFSRFIELGTGRGNMSMYFYLFCLNRNAEFITYEYLEKFKVNDTPLKRKLNFADNIRSVDMFKEKDTIIDEINKAGRTILFCDGLDKPYEIEVFCPNLKVGDILAVHDWGRAVKYDWVSDILEYNNYKFIFKKELEELGTITGVFIKEFDENLYHE